MCDQPRFLSIPLHKQHWSHDRPLVIVFHQGQGRFPWISTHVVLEVAHYGLRSNGRLQNWGKTAPGEPKVSVMELVVEKWGQSKWAYNQQPPSV